MASGPRFYITIVSHPRFNSHAIPTGACLLIGKVLRIGLHLYKISLTHSHSLDPTNEINEWVCQIGFLFHPPPEKSPCTPFSYHYLPPNRKMELGAPRKPTLKQILDRHPATRRLKGTETINFTCEYDKTDNDWTRTFRTILDELKCYIHPPEPHKTERGPMPPNQIYVNFALPWLGSHSVILDSTSRELIGNVISRFKCVTLDPFFEEWVHVDRLISEADQISINFEPPDPVGTTSWIRNNEPMTLAMHCPISASCSHKLLVHCSFDVVDHRGKLIGGIKGLRHLVKRTSESFNSDMFFNVGPWPIRPDHKAHHNVLVLLHRTLIQNEYELWKILNCDYGAYDRNGELKGEILPALLYLDDSQN